MLPSDFVHIIHIEIVRIIMITWDWILTTVFKTAVYMLCCCLRHYECSSFWYMCTFQNVRIDIFKALFEDDTKCSDVFVNAMGIILTTTKLASLSDTQLLDLTTLLTKCTPCRIRCDQFPSFGVEEFACKRLPFWNLYLCLVEHIDHSNSNVSNPLLPVGHGTLCECTRMVDNETFPYLLRHQNQLTHFDAIWHPFFGNKRIIWFADHYLHHSPSNTARLSSDRTELFHNDVFSILLKSICGNDKTGWDELLRVLRSIRSEDGFELTSTGRKAVDGVALAVYPYHLFHEATQLCERSSEVQWQCLQECCRRVNYERPSMPPTMATITNVRKHMEGLCLPYAKRERPVEETKDMFIFDCAIVLLAGIKRMQTECIGVQVLDALNNLVDNPLFDYANASNLVHSGLDIRNITAPIR